MKKIKLSEVNEIITAKDLGYVYIQQGASLNRIKVEKINRLNINIAPSDVGAWELGYYDLNGNKVNNDAAITNIRVKNKIKIPKGAKLIYGAIGGELTIHFFDFNHQFISWKTANNGTVIITPVNAEYITLNIGNQANWDKSLIIPQNVSWWGVYVNVLI